MAALPWRRSQLRRWRVRVLWTRRTLLRPETVNRGRLYAKTVIANVRLIILASLKKYLIDWNFSQNGDQSVGRHVRERPTVADFVTAEDRRNGADRYKTVQNFQRSSSLTRMRVENFVQVNLIFYTQI